MHIGVPAGDERHVELPGEVGAKDAELTGAGDVDDVGPEGAHCVRDQIGVAEEERVEAEVLFQMHGERAAA